MAISLSLCSEAWPGGPRTLLSSAGAASAALPRMEKDWLASLRLKVNADFRVASATFRVNYSFGFCTINEQQTITSPILLDQSGQPILDQSGDPLVDQTVSRTPGEPILDQNGDEILNHLADEILDQGTLMTAPIIFPNCDYGSWSSDLGVFYQTAQENQGDLRIKAVAACSTRPITHCWIRETTR